MTLTVHAQFRELLAAIKPLDAGITRLFKELVLRAWNDEYGAALQSASAINHEIDIQKEPRQH